MIRIRAFEEQANSSTPREDARPHPPLRRRGGRRRRRLLGAPPRRHDHLDPPRPRPLPREGRRARPDVLPSCSARRRLLPRQGRLDAHRRPRATATSARTRSSAASAGIATGAAFSAQAARHRPGRGLLLRRGRARPGPALRGDEHGRALEAAGHLRLREQPVQRVHALSTRSTAGTITARAEAFGIPAEEVDGQDVRAVYAATTRAASTRARAGDGPAFLRLRHLPLPRPPRRRRRPRLLPREGRGAAVADGARPDRAAARGWLDDGLAELDAADASRSRPRSPRPSQYALDAPYPGPERGDEHVYA